MMDIGQNGPENMLQSIRFFLIHHRESMIIRWYNDVSHMDAPFHLTGESIKNDERVESLRNEQSRVYSSVGICYAIFYTDLCRLVPNRVDKRVASGFFT